MLRDEVEKALQVLKDGGIILYPTDTIWGIGCDATNEEAVSKIFKIKGREESKSMIVLLDTENKLASYVNNIPEIAYDLIEYAENPLTIIYSGAKNLAKNAIGTDGSIAIRIAKNDFCQQLIQRFRKPIISTSANISGEQSPAKFDEIADEIKESVNYIVDWEQEKSTPKKPSTILKLEPDGKFQFIRK